MREGRPLAVEVQAGEGRRAFIVILPEGGASTLNESLRHARAEGGIPTAHTFLVRHDEYDEQQLGGSDYDIGQLCHSEMRAGTVEQAEAVLTGWGFDPGLLVAYHQTDAR